MEILANCMYFVGTRTGWSIPLPEHLKLCFLLIWRLWCARAGYGRREKKCCVETLPPAHTFRVCVCVVLIYLHIGITPIRTLGFDRQGSCGLTSPCFHGCFLCSHRRACSRQTGFRLPRPSCVVYLQFHVLVWVIHSNFNVLFNFPSSIWITPSSALLQVCGGFYCLSVALSTPSRIALCPRSRLSHSGQITPFISLLDRFGWCAIHTLNSFLFVLRCLFTVSLLISFCLPAVQLPVKRDNWPNHRSPVIAV